MTRHETNQLRRSVADFLSLERNVMAASGAVFLVGLGEELWKKFLPKYLEAVGATTPIIGVFGTAQDLLDAVYQYPGGWIADRLGRRSAFLIFLALATAGYLVYLLSPSWPWLFLGLALVMAWQSMARRQFSQSSATRCRANVARWASLCSRFSNECPSSLRQSSVGF